MIRLSGVVEVAIFDIYYPCVTDVLHGYLKNRKGGYLFIQTKFDKLGSAVIICSVV